MKKNKTNKNHKKWKKMLWLLIIIVLTTLGLILIGTVNSKGNNGFQIINEHNIKTILNSHDGTIFGISNEKLIQLQSGLIISLVFVPLSIVIAIFVFLMLILKFSKGIAIIIGLFFLFLIAGIITLIILTV